MAEGAPHPPPEQSDAGPPRPLAEATALPPRRRLQQAVLDPRRIIGWVYLGRFSVATAIFLAAQLVWASAPATDTRIASLIFAVTMVVTAVSAAYTEVYRAPMGHTFLYLQAVYDLLLVTAVVHLTGGGGSQFTLFYILVIASAALLLPIGSGLLIALLGIVCYFAEVLWLSGAAPDLGVWLQLVVFAMVALACGYISARLQEAGEGTAAELVFVRLQADDILRNIRSGIITIDDHGVLLYANPAASALLGIPFVDLIGTPILGRIFEISPALARALQRAAADRVRTTRAEDVVRFPDHSFPIGVTTTFADVDGSGHRRTATAIFQDISGLKRLESLHLGAGRLEAIAELSASLAHEIRNPLASIRSAVEQLTRPLALDGEPSTLAQRLDGKAGGRGKAPGTRRGATLARGSRGASGAAAHRAVAMAVDEDARTLGQLVMRETDRLSRLLSEFLDFARVRVTTTSPVDLCTVARGAAALLGAHPDLKEGARVHCVIPDLPVVIDGDEDLLHRAVFNLVLNAVQAAPAGGEVRIEVLALTVDELPTGVTTDSFYEGAAIVRVIDDGPGIAPDVRDRLFEPFTTTKPGGTGLGLSVVHRAIEAHRGLVLVDSNGEMPGTRMTVLLPKVQSRQMEVGDTDDREVAA
jgi:two-component system sensor histidine kinase PilS (NtrC family)